MIIVSINFNQKAICAKYLSSENKTTLELFVSFTHKLQMWQFRKFQNSHNSPWFMFTVRDMCLHRLHISFVVQTKHVSFTVIYHSVSLQINKNKYCFTFTCPKFYFQLFLHKTQRYTKACVLSQIISMSEELKSVTFIKQTNKRSEV